MKNLDEIYDFLVNKPSDINEHLPTLKSLASECDTVIEMGVRWVVSTWALLAARPKSLTSIDINHPSKHGVDLDKVKGFAQDAGVPFEFIEGDTTKIEIDECDFLFIDTWHVYDQLKTELELHGNKAKKYLAFHDTVTFGDVGESSGYKGLMPAIEEFLEQNPHWTIKHHYTNNNGLLVLERHEDSIH